MPLSIECKSCGTSINFDQPYPYHAGFGNQGFLYDDTGSLTLVWSSFDPAYEEVVGARHPWMLSEDLQKRLEDRLAPTPDGRGWRFANPARCPACASPISGSILETIYYVVWPGSVLLDRSPRQRAFASALRELRGS